MRISKNQTEIIGKTFFSLLIIVCLVNLFYLPNYFTDRFFTSGMIWIGMAVPLFLLLFLFIRKGEIHFPPMMLYIGGLITTSSFYAVFSGMFSYQYMAFTISLFLLTLMLANSKEALNLRMVYGVLVGVAFVESLIGMAQYVHWYEVYNYRFPVTGTFENPAGFAACLAVCFPFVFSFIFEKSKYARWSGAFVSALSVVAILLSGSRTGMVAILVVTAFAIGCRFKMQRKAKRWLWVGGICMSILLCVVLYGLKKDSADGRLLIWRSTIEMICDQPLIGHGPGSFGGRYMEYQARFLTENTNPRLEQLADNVKHPFNEFLKIGAEYGIIGLILIGGGVVWLFRIAKRESEEKQPLFLCLVALAVCGLFSYPLNYPAIDVLLFMVLGMILRNESSCCPAERTIKWAFGGLAVGLFCFTVYWKQMEECWSDVVCQALSGNEEVMEQYQTLYPFLRENPLFLYNYGAELNARKQWEESNRILREAVVLLNDTDVQLLLADNATNLGEYNQAEIHLQLASAMCPNRFIPLYELVKLHVLTGHPDKARQIAQKITNKPQKIPSYTVDKIKQEMDIYIKQGILE